MGVLPREIRRERERCVRQARRVTETESAKQANGRALET